MPNEFDVFTCPFCQEDLSYRVNGEKYSSMAGIEIQGGYDGISYYACPKCKVVWDRFTGEKEEDWKWGG
jgi:hypothetical protein